MTLLVMRRSGPLMYQEWRHGHVQNWTGQASCPNSHREVGLYGHVESFIRRAGHAPQIVRHCPGFQLADKAAA